VASSRGKCKKNRNVTLVKKKRNGTRRAVGRDTTNKRQLVDQDGQEGSFPGGRLSALSQQVRPQPRLPWRPLGDHPQEEARLNAPLV